MVKVGCCGFPVKMGEYFKRFRVVEVQRTFYELPEVKTAIRWREEAPPGFEFTMKALQLITHPPGPTYKRMRKKPSGDFGFFKPNKDVFSAWEKTKEIAQALGARKILFQSPPSFSENEENVENLYSFFTKIEREGLELIWEPRGLWDPNTITKICRDLDLVHCTDPFKNKPLHGKFIYLRLHGGKNYKHKYSDQELLSLKELVETYVPLETYVLFNNVYMYEDAWRFCELIGLDPWDEQ